MHVSYRAKLAATSGKAPYRWSVARTRLPKGLALSAATGVLFGKPTAKGRSTFTVSVTDSSKPTTSDSVACTLTVKP